MDWQIFFNAAVAIAGFFGGWILNRITSMIDRLDQDVRSMPREYVQKSDYDKDIGEIKGMLKEIYTELRHKEDRK